MNRKTPIPYSTKELGWIRDNSARPRREAHIEFCKKFGRGDVSLDNFKSLCTRNGWKTGRTGHFQKGQEPSNKGRKMPYNANSAKTQFKKGREPHNTKPPGHEWLHPDGYVYLIVNETNPHTGYKHRSVLKHRYLWEQKNGKLPDGMVLKCLDGDKKNTDPSNWEAIPLGVNARLNSRWSRLRYSEAPADLKPSVMALAKLKQEQFCKARKMKEGDK